MMRTLIHALFAIGMALPAAAQSRATQPDQAPQRAGTAPKIRYMAATLAFNVEGESMAGTAQVSAGAAQVQPMQGFGGQWSGDAQLFWSAPAPVHQPVRKWPDLRLGFDVEQEGRYAVALVHTVAPDYGKFRVFLDGKQVADVDGWGAQVDVRRHELGTHDLAAGVHQLVMTVFEKNAASSGHFVGIDRLELKPAEAAAAPAGKRRRPGLRDAAASSARRRDRVSRRGLVQELLSEQHLMSLPAKQRADLITFLGSGTPARTFVRVWQGPGCWEPDDSQPPPACFVRGPVKADWEKKAELLDWWFEWKTEQPGTASAVWQLSRYPLPPLDAGWKSPPGLVARGTLPDPAPAGTGMNFRIGLGAFAPRPPWWPQPLSLADQPVRHGEQNVPGRSPSVLGRKPSSGSTAPAPTPRASRRAGATEATYAGAPVPGTVGSGSVAAADSFAALPPSNQLHVRVVPLDAKGQPVGRPGNTVTVEFVPFEAPPPARVVVLPDVQISGYRPVRSDAFDFRCHLEATRDFKVGGFVLAEKGEKKNVCDDDSDLIGDIVDAVGDFFELLAEAVDWASKTYADLKQKAVDSVASGLSGLGVPCHAPCKLALQAGLDYGLAATGMPPSLPDFDQLQDMGEGYVAKVVSEELTAQTGVPVPEEVVQKAVHDFIETGADALKQGKDLPVWIPDSSYRYRPPAVTLVVQAGHQSTVPPVSLTLREKGGGRYLPATVKIPALAPDEQVKIIVALTPTKDPGAWQALLPSASDFAMSKTYFQKLDAAAKALASWQSSYLGGELQLVVEMAHAGGIEEATAAVFPAQP